MRLHTIKPGAGSKPVAKRLGRGIGSGLGKTCGRGHKGQRARAGGYHKVGFEGGQMPLQRRLPKIGFNSHMAQFSAEIGLYRLAQLDAEVVDVALVKSLGLVPEHAKRIKLIAKGTVERAYKIKGLSVSKGARAAIEAAG